MKLIYYIYMCVYIYRGAHNWYAGTHGRKYAGARIADEHILTSTPPPRRWTSQKLPVPNPTCDYLKEEAT